MFAQLETSPTLSERTENAARGIASLVLHSLPSASSRRSTVCIFANDCEKGIVALRAGVHLCNRGVKVVVFAMRSQAVSDAYTRGLRVSSASGSRVVREVEGAFSCLILHSFLFLTILTSLLRSIRS